MALRALLVLTLIFVGSVLGQTGDVIFREWPTIQVAMKKVEDKLQDVERWQNNVEALEARLNATTEEFMRQKFEFDALKKENKELQMRLNTTEEESDKLKQTTAHIAFSASLVNSGEIYKGPCEDKILVFKRIFTNSGSGYDPETGTFTAPVKGLYYFSFSTYGYNTHVLGAALMKDGVRQVSTYDSPSADGSDSSSNAVILELDAGDRVYMELWENGRVYDNPNGHTTFSGFLLFPV